MHEASRSTRVALKVAIAAQGVSEPLKCGSVTVRRLSLTDMEHSFGLAFRCCGWMFTVFVRKGGARSDGMVFPVETVGDNSLFDRGRGGA